MPSQGLYSDLIRLETPSRGDDPRLGTAPSLSTPAPSLDAPASSLWAAHIGVSERHVHRTALLDTNSCLTFGESAVLAARAGAALAAARLSVIVFFLPRCPWLALATLGAARSATPWVLGDASRPAPHRAAVVASLVRRVGTVHGASPRIGVVALEEGGGGGDGVTWPAGTVVLRVEDMLRGPPNTGEGARACEAQLQPPALEVSSSDACAPALPMRPLYLMQTSGSSTGEPRWVVGSASATALRIAWTGAQDTDGARTGRPHESRAVAARLWTFDDRSCTDACAASPRCACVDVCLWRCPLAFVDTVAEMWAGLLRGCPTAVLAEPGAAAATAAVAALVDVALGRRHPPLVETASSTHLRSQAPSQLLHAPTDVSSLARCIAEHGVTRLTATPALLQVRAGAVRVVDTSRVISSFPPVPCRLSLPLTHCS